MGILLRSFSRHCRPRDLILDIFAARISRPEISEKLTEYINAKNEFRALIKKYDVFCDKSKSVDDAAKLVGLRVPKKSS